MNSKKVDMSLENLLVDMLINHPHLEKIELRIREATNQPKQDFIEEVKYLAGGYMSDGIAAKIDWEYVGSHWWDEKQEAEKMNLDYINHVSHMWAHRG